MNNKAIFSTISGFFLVVVIVFAVISIIGFYSGLVEVNSQSRQDLRVYQDAGTFKDNLLACHGKTFLRENMLQQQTEDGPCNIPGDIMGYKVQLQECSNTSYTAGTTSDQNAQRIPYKISVLRDDNVTTCVSTLNVYI